MTSKISLEVKVVSKGGFVGNVEIDSLDITTQQLKEILSTLTQISPPNMRILVGGRILKDDELLSKQNVKPNSKLMVLQKKSQQSQPTDKTDDKRQVDKDNEKKKEISEDEKKRLEEEKKASRIQRILAAAEELAKRRDGGDDRDEQYHLVIENQFGEKVSIGETDRKNLSIAMTLHEKGRNFIKSKEYLDALDCLLLSDEYFRKVSPFFLQAVDNYAYVNLDIVWCYFKLQDPKMIYDAKDRLALCEQTLARAHGPNMERLKRLKNGYCPEISLYCRLHILQAVAAYHTGHKQKAKMLFFKAQHELNSLKINEEHISQLKSMGFTEKEARLALRATGHNVEQSAAYILEQRDLKKEKKMEEKQRKKERRLKFSLGKTINDNFVNIKMYNEFIQMGFPKEIVAEALRQSDNNQEKTLQLLTESRDVLEAIVSANVQKKLKSKHLKYLQSMGFSKELSKAALKQSNYDIQVALDKLLSGEVIPPKSNDTPPSTQQQQKESQQKKEESFEEYEDEKEREIEETIDEEIVDSIKEDSEDFMDIALLEEEEIINKYLRDINEGK